MKILVVAKALRLAYSEGICTSKFLLALRRAGYDVCCLTSDDVVSSHSEMCTAPWLGGIHVNHIKPADGRRSARFGSASRRLAGSGRLGAFANWKVNSAFKYATGYSCSEWLTVDCWYRAIRREFERQKPDLVFVRSAGSEFEPHMAMLRWRPPVPWVANYHDPYPMSLYPDPYRYRVPVMSGRQEATHRRILDSADALTFPSQRLLEWVLSGDSEQHRRKAFVIPHCAAELSAPRPASDAVDGAVAGDDDFNVVHTGTLLEERDPTDLLKGFEDFVGQDREKRERARLVFVGSIKGKNRRHLEASDWSELVESGNLVWLDERVSYQKALEVARSGVAVVVLEAAAVESPFFPAKLTDYLWLRKPILTLSPQRSVSADILGENYGLRVAPDDRRGVTVALNTLWNHWVAGSLGELVPPAEILDSLSESAVCGRFADVVRYASRHRATWEGG